MRTNSKFLASLALVSLVYHFVFPQYAWADFNLIEESQIELIPLDGLTTLQGQALIQPTNPETQIVIASQWVTITGYSSTPDQTDSTPFITASGTYVRDGIVACNFLAFGTKVRFPELYGDKIFVVEDRMAPKNSHKIDIWFPTRWQALEFGVQKTKVEILQS
jgi:3D (Asp-Asp-Asp) domain-containing protein